MTTPKKGRKAAVETSSRIRVWWLTAFMDYRVRQVRSTPCVGSFGRIRYERQWILTERPLKKSE